MKDWNEDYINNLKEIDKHIKDSTVKLNYEFITEHYFEMYEVALNAGTIMPYRFNAIGLAYIGEEHSRPTKFKNFDPKVKERLVKSYATRNELQYKYKDPNIDPKEKYEKFLDKEIYDFIEEFPQFKDVIINE
ncbi:hypothetical protein [Methanosphaera sp. BMS]|uniref:hypothetical protein n=1 Tax=Methanosphaera sp. BMS TaxID=1789762 RepID=UPI000DC1D08E|nr:hypothetical protein [Methanosphaera sp. BMS]AWX31664.1 hypothetical protein AW729_00555 [Methanosphaera sp. BMS]